MTTMGVTNILVIILRLKNLLIYNISKKISGLVFRQKRAEKNSSCWSL
jgi:hypothetical protein